MVYFFPERLLSCKYTLCILSHSDMSDSLQPYGLYIAHQVPLSMGFSRQEYWSGCHALLQGIFLTQGWNPNLLCLLNWQAGSLPLSPSGKSIHCTSNLKFNLQTILFFLTFFHSSPKNTIIDGILFLYNRANLFIHPFMFPHLSCYKVFTLINISGIKALLLWPHLWFLSYLE